MSSNNVYQPLTTGRMPRAALALALVATTLLVNGCSDKSDKGRDKAASKPRAVARLTSAAGAVSHRSATKLTWEDAQSGMSLAERDAVRTGDDGLATITFIAGGGKLEVEQHSLVVIEAPRTTAPPKATGEQKPAHAPAAAPVAKVERGTVRGIAKPGGAPLRVVTPDGKTTEIVATGAEPASIRLRVDDKGKLEVAVLKGAATLRTGGRQVKVAPKQVVDVTGGQVSQPVALLPYPELTVPGIDAKVAIGQGVELQWNAVEGAHHYRVQVSRSLDFSDKVFDRLVAEPRFVATDVGGEQTYAWRVGSVDAGGHEGEFGFARRFTTLQGAPATQPAAPPPEVLVAPADNAAIVYVKTSRPIDFRWQGDATAYELVVARRPSLNRGVVLRQRLQTTEYRLRRLKPGRYFWGVFAIDGKAKKALFERPRRFAVGWRRPPKVKVPNAIDWKEQQ